MTTKVKSSTIDVAGLSIANTQITGLITSGQIQSIPTTNPTTFTSTQSFIGSASSESLKITNGAENAYIIVGAPTSTANVYLANGSVQFYTSNTTTNWTTNISWSSGTTINTVMSVGDCVTLALITSQGGSAFYSSTVKIDGTTVNPRWQGGGVAPSAGNANGIDVYTYTIIKTSATPTYSVLAAQTQY
jgi:hypothetical protein